MRRAFTLLEILAALVVSLILALVGTLTYSTLKDSIADRDAKNSVERVLTAERNWAARNGSWTQDPNELTGTQGLTVTAGASTEPGIVSISTQDGLELGVATLSESGTCLAAYAADPLVGSGFRWVEMPSTQPCSGQVAVLSEG